MKAKLNKQTGKMTMKVKKPPIVSHWSNPKTDEKAAREFGKTLKASGDKLTTLKQVSDKKYVDTRPSINKK